VLFRSVPVVRYRVTDSEVSPVIRFHFIWLFQYDAVFNNTIGDIKRVNHTRWFYHIFLDGLTNVTALVVFRVDQFNTILLAFMLFAAIMSLNYFQDFYLLPSQHFHAPSGSLTPHSFSFLLHVFLSVFIAMYCLERVIFETVVQLVLAIVLMALSTNIFFIQKFHVAYVRHYFVDKHHHDDDTVIFSNEESTRLTMIGEEEDEDTDSEKNERTTEIDLEKHQELDKIISNHRTGAWVEGIYYLNSFLMHLVATTLVLNQDLDLHW